jgi:hypothetical protein
MRNLSTGAIAYVGPKTRLDDDVQSIKRHLHFVKRELNVLKHSILPSVAFQVIQFIGRIPMLFPIPFGLLPESDWNPFRAYFAIPLIRQALVSCKLEIYRAIFFCNLTFVCVCESPCDIDQRTGPAEDD